MEESQLTVGYLKEGCFRKPGTLHLHVDARDREFVWNILRKIVEADSDLGGDSNTVIASVAGSQFKNDAHNPAGHGEEHFISVPFKDRQQAVTTLKRVLDLIHESKGVVVEVERVLGRMETANPNYSSADFPWFQSRISEGEVEGEVRFASAPSPPVELHHCFAVPKAIEGPFSRHDLPFIRSFLQELCDNLESEGLHVRTWSLFYSPDVWSFRSTVFAHGLFFDKRCHRDFDLLSRYLTNRNVSFRDLRVVVEQVVGIWQTPLGPSNEQWHPNQVPVESLIGATDVPLPLATLVDECHASRNQRLTGASETIVSDIGEIMDGLESFEKIVKARGLDPILIELAINDKLPVASRAKSLDSLKGSFGSQIVSYFDTETSIVLNAWRKAIDGIVEDHPLHINPIVSHPETYRCGFLHQELRGPVKLAFSVRSGGIPDATEEAESVLRMSVSDQESDPIKSASRDVYDFCSVETPAPVQNTVESLARGFVYNLMDVVATDEAATTEIDGVLHVLHKLLSSHLLIVPFSWPAKNPGNATGELTQNQVTPGGCLFVILSPGPRMQSVEIEELKNTAVRISWVLLRSALELAYTDAGVSTKRASPSWDIKRKFLANHDKLKLALESIEKLPAEERLAHVTTHAPFLRDTNKHTLGLLRRGLSGDDLFLGGTSEIFRLKVLKSHSGFCPVRGTIFEWKKQIAGQGVRKAASNSRRAKGVDRRKSNAVKTTKRQTAKSVKKV